VKFEILQQLIASNIREIRSKRGISQEELAFRAEVDRTYVSQLERGIANPSIQVLSRISEALEADLQVVLIDRT
jgi:transcriptional regulator with XRE-family HTH domain